VPPRTPAEQVVTAIWSDILKVERIGIYDNFFELGGHSLRAVQVISQVYEIFQIELPLISLFEKPTIDGLVNEMAQLLGGREIVEEVALGFNEPKTQVIPQRKTGDPCPLSFAQQRLWFLDQLEPGSTTYLIPHALSLQGELSVSALERSLSELV